MQETALAIEITKLRVAALTERWPSIHVETFLKESSFGFVVYLTADEQDYLAFLSGLKTVGIAAETLRIRGNAYEVYIDLPASETASKTPQNEA